MSDNERPLPACITRDNLTSPYFPNLSLAGLAAVIALGLIFTLTSFNRLNHTDLWGHVNFGRWMTVNQAWPAADPFAASASDKPVLQGAWLAQVAAYQIQRLFGNEGLVFGHAILVTLAAAVLMLAVRRRGAPALWCWSAGIAMFALDLPIVGTIRPQLFGQLGAALVLLACAELPARKHPLVWLPLVAVLWANLHASVPMGLLMLGICACGVSWRAYVETQDKPMRLLSDRRLWIVWGALAVTLAATAINPHGFALLPRIALFNQHTALASISEWRALTPGSLTGMLFLASLAITALLVKTSPRKWEVAEIALLVVFGIGTLMAIRMLAWWAIVWPWVCIPHAAAAWRHYRLAKESDVVFDTEEPTAMRTVLAMGFCFMVVLIAPPSYAALVGVGRGEGPTTVKDTPLYLADEIVRRDLAGAIAAPMDWADFLVWKTGGKLKPLVHSHVHLLADDDWRAYEAIFRGEAEWLSLLGIHSMQYVVVPQHRFPALAKQVLIESRKSDGRLRIVYQDQRCILAEVLPPIPAQIAARE